MSVGGGDENEAPLAGSVRRVAFAPRAADGVDARAVGERVGDSRELGNVREGSRAARAVVSAGRRLHVAVSGLKLKMWLQKFWYGLIPAASICASSPG